MGTPILLTILLGAAVLLINNGNAEAAKLEAEKTLADEHRIHMSQAKQLGKDTDSLLHNLKNELHDTKTATKHVTAEIPAPPPTYTASDTPYNRYFYMPAGIFYLLVGYRFYRPAMCLAGVVFGATVTFVASAPGPYALILSPIVGGILGGICLFSYPVGVGMLGLNFGAVLGLILNTILQIEGWGMYVWLTITGLCGAAFVMNDHYHKVTDESANYAKVVIYLKTSVVGAYLFIRALGGQYGGFPYEPHPYPQPIDSPLYMALVVVTAAVGVWLQMQFTHRDHCGFDFSEDLEDEKANGEEEPLVKKGDELESKESATMGGDDVESKDTEDTVVEPGSLKPGSHWSVRP